jgi:hypothetical protein
MPAITMPSISNEGIAFHDHAVGEGAGIAFIGIAHDVFLFGPFGLHAPSST